MAGGLPHPFLLSTALHMDTITIGGQVIDIKHVFYTWLAMAILFTAGFLVRRNITMVPGKLQNFFEVVIGELEEFVVSNCGNDGRIIFPVLGALFMFILTMNFLGLMPGCDAPTANINTNIGMALFIFCYYNYQGMKRWGVGYIKHFMGPKAWLAPLMLPIELVSHLARPLSLTLRLFGNIRGEEIVILLFFVLAPLAGTLPIYFLFLLGKTMQAFIFFMLSMFYLKGAMEHAH